MGVPFWWFWGPDPLREHFLRSKGCGAPPRCLLEDFATISDGFGLHLEAISGPFWSHAGPLRAKVATQTPKKEVWREVQNQDRKKVRFGPSREGVRRVHSCTIAQFSLFRPCPSGLHFCLHFEAIWGTKFATILFLGHRRRQQAAQLGTCFRGCFLGSSEA